jgi:hypothetical protein
VFSADVLLSYDKPKRNRLIIKSLRIIGSPLVFSFLIGVDWLIRGLNQHLMPRIGVQSGCNVICMRAVAQALAWRKWPQSLPYTPDLE